MQDQYDNISKGGPSRPVVDPDEIIGLVIDGEASDADWKAFSASADESPELWKRLGQHARVHAMLGRAMGELDASLNISLRSSVSGDGGTAVAVRSSERERVGSILFASAAARAVRGGGWLAAAGVALAWAVMHLVHSPQHGLMQVADNGNSNGVGVVDGGMASRGVLVTTAADALDAYRTLARFDGVDVDESPEQIVLQVLPALDGRSIEVVAVRQLVERRILDGLYRVAADDGGAPALVPLHVSYEHVRDEEAPPEIDDALGDV